MSWTYLSRALDLTLPDHCYPENQFIVHFSSVFDVCIPTPLAFISNTFGILSIIAWLFAQLPQIYKNWSIQSTSGLSIFFLVEWCLGDLSNLLGALFTHQASWQVTIGAYYVFVDLCLVGQWLWYERLKHGRPVLVVWKSKDDTYKAPDPDSMVQRQPTSDTAPPPPTNNIKPRTNPRIIFRAPSYQPSSPPDHSTSSEGIHRTHLTASTSPFPQPSPRTMLLIACIIALAHATPTPHHHHTLVQTPPPLATSTSPTPLETAGTILSWLSTILYLGSRLPQLLLNFRRKSTAGLSPHLFIAAFAGNCFYSSALATNPSAWYDFGPYGGGGWAGESGSVRAEWVAAALPFFLGAAGVLVLDASVGVQFLVYGEGARKVVVVEAGEGEELRVQKGRWRRVSGWMRGWIPSMSVESRSEERQRLIVEGSGRTDDQTYGTL